MSCSIRLSFHCYIHCSRGNPFSLLVALNGTASACGQLFLDDGESLTTVEDEHYTLLDLKTEEVKDNYAQAMLKELGSRNDVHRLLPLTPSKA